MSVTVRKFRTGGWEVDIHVILPNGTRRRGPDEKVLLEVRGPPLGTRSGARPAA